MLVKKRVMFVRLMCVVIAILIYANVASAGVIYEFIETGTGDVKGTLNFLDTVASATSGWSATDLDFLGTLLEGGISGLSWDFGSGLVPATSEEPLFGSEKLASSTGLELTAGFLLYLDDGITFGPGETMETFIFGDTTSDEVLTFDSGVFAESQGDWTLVPEPSTLVLLALGFLGILGLSYRQRKKAV